MGFCTITPGEVSTLQTLISQSDNRVEFDGEGEMDKTGEGTLFDSELVSINDDLVNEAPDFDTRFYPKLLVTDF